MMNSTISNPDQEVKLYYSSKIEDIKREKIAFVIDMYEEIKNEYAIRKENGIDVKFIDEKTNPFSFDLKAGVYSINGGAEIDPYKFTKR